MIDLGDLEFKAEDVVTLPLGTCEQIAACLNRLLREKLEKAPKLFTHRADVRRWLIAHVKEDVLTARLVCVEEVKK